MRLVLGALTAVALALPATAVVAGPITSATAADASALGSSAATAAGSCWEIKQQQPAVTDGAYWLLTPAMTEPAQFYCDMTTDGGGWVLVGKGRDGWTNAYDGKGDASTLLTGDTTPTTTVQLPAATINALLDNGRVDALSDSIRLRRATNTAGTTWQESRFKFANRSRWVWTMAAEHGLGAWSIGTATGTGGTMSSTWGTDTAYNRVNPTGMDAQDNHLGFAFGASVAGTSSDSSYLWSLTTGAGNALPYTQVWLRPRITSQDADFTAIPDSGTKAVTMPALPKSRALASPWGVTGLAGDTSTEGNVEVQAFTQSGNTMYVGGNFRYVQKDAAGTGRVDQPFLAGFDITTGELVTTFRPVLNEQVRTLATLPDGSIVAGGIFTQVNGAAAAGLVALDPTTGATKTAFKVAIANTSTTSSAVQVRSVDISGGYVYFGGTFTSVAGGTRTTAVSMKNLGRVSVTDGTPTTNWNPNINGTVNDLDVSDDGSRVYASGYFTAANGAATASYRVASISTATGAAGTAWSPTWSNSNNYQRTIAQAGSRVYVGGSEHSLFGFDTSSLSRVSGSIMKAHGDIQVTSYDPAKGVLYAGCHCNDFSYQDAYTWSSVGTGWTQADALNWFGAWDAKTGARLPNFLPQMSMRAGSGIWAITTDSAGNVWAGGDVATVATKTQAAAWSGGFARFDPADVTAPATPSGFSKTSETSDTVTFGWSTVSDSSTVHYDVLRDDRVVGTTSGNTGALTVPKGGSGRFFLRAVDGAGNVSASTSVVVVGSGLVAPTSAFTWTSSYSRVSVDGSTSSSPNGSIADYTWDFGDSAGAKGATASHTYAAAGSYVVKLTVTDSAGATASTTSSVTVAAPASPSPTDVYGAEVYKEAPYLYYRLGETSGTTAADSGPDARPGTYSGTLSRGVSGALKNSSDPATGLVGSAGFVVSPTRLTTAPTAFSTDIWFKTTSTSGGRLIGYANSNTGSSSQYDRHMFLQSDGRLVFGAYTGTEQRVTSTRAYNDGVWHQAVATQSPTDGMKLYVDGALIGTNAATSGENFLGYWKVGGDTVWSGASSNYLTGTIDEAAVFTRALTAAEIAEQYRLGSTVVTAPVSNPPTAAFGATVNSLAVSFDGSASTDSDGTIASYRWDYGDGTTGSGQLSNHTYAAAGSYTVSLTVTDNSGQLTTLTKSVTTTAPPVTSVVVDNKQPWSWRYATGAPATDWNKASFDATTWSSGAAPLGFGSTGLGTNVDSFSTTSARPLAAYFTKTFQVTDAGKVTRLLLSTYADDGVVVYVNGTEVARSNIAAGVAVTSGTFANKAPKTATATATPLTIEVPVSLLTSGTNVISAETHLNSRSTVDMSFDLKATITTAG